MPCLEIEKLQVWLHQATVTALTVAAFLGFLPDHSVRFLLPLFRSRKKGFATYYYSQLTLYSAECLLNSELDAETFPVEKKRPFLSI